MRARLFAALNIAVIALCGAVLVNRILSQSKSPMDSSVQLAAGQRVLHVGALGLAKAPKTLVLVTSSGCHFCLESIPFYRKLSEAVAGSGTRLIAVAWEAPEKNVAFLSSHGVSVETTLSVSQSRLAVYGTPTLVLLRRDGVVIKTWEGKLSHGAESEVLSLATGKGIREQ